MFYLPVCSHHILGCETVLCVLLLHLLLGAAGGGEYGAASCPLLLHPLVETTVGSLHLLEFPQGAAGDGVLLFILLFIRGLLLFRILFFLVLFFLL